MMKISQLTVLAAITCASGNTQALSVSNNTSVHVQEENDFGNAYTASVMTTFNDDDQLDIIMAKSVGELRDGISQCTADSGCTCTAKNMKESPNECVLVKMKTEITNNWDPLSGTKCNQLVEMIPYDCNICPGQVTNEFSSSIGKNIQTITKGKTHTYTQTRNKYVALGGSSTTGWEQFCVRINDFPENDFLSYDQSTSKNYDFWSSKTKCTNTLQIRGCMGPTRTPSAFIENYNAGWILEGTGADLEIALTSTFSEENKDEQKQSFQEGWKLGGKVTYGSVEVTAEYSGQIEQQATSTLSLTSTTTYTQTCKTNCNQNDYVYVWAVAGMDSSDPRWRVDVPNCLFHCTDPHMDAGNPPVCPPQYCDPTRGTCQCCTSLAWAAPGTNPSDLPPLCSGY